MRTIGFILRKEFIQVFRNKTMLPIIFLLPVIQLVILVNAATMDMKSINLLIEDFDMSQASRQLISKFDGSPFYKISEQSLSPDYSASKLLDNTADAVLSIPAGFERNLQHNDDKGLQLQINAINGTTAGLVNAYSNQIIHDFLLNDFQSQNPQYAGFDMHALSPQYSYWYNPDLKFKNFMLPGILVILVTIIGLFLTALNIVREKEMGTIEQINVTPIKKYQFIIGKLTPFWIIGLVELAIGLLVGVLFFNLQIQGSLLVLFSFAAIYLLLVLGLGLLLSNISSTQQQVMFLTFFFMLTFVLMSGIFTPLESMPAWAEYVNYFNPMAYFMKAIRMIILKGSGFTHIWPLLLQMTIFAAIAISLAVWRYRKTV